jgi:hypothetical protein
MSLFSRDQPTIYHPALLMSARTAYFSYYYVLIAELARCSESCVPELGTLAGCM